MKHLAARAWGVTADKPFTATGLGDRTHQVTCAWAYGQAHGLPVTLHIDKRKMVGGQFRNKPESWREIVSLFPAGSVYVRFHDIEPADEEAWLLHLAERGIPAQLWRYGDFRAMRDDLAGVDIAPYLKNIPRLTAEPVDIPLPERFVTEQWDASGPARRFGDCELVRSEWCSRGYDLLALGAWCSVREAAFALSRAKAHIGVDSGFFHLAQLYMPPHWITIYHGESQSHHLKRARANGVRVCAHA